MNLKTLFSLVHDEKSATKFLQDHNIIKRSRNCDNGHSMDICYAINRFPYWQCFNRQCRLRHGVLQGSWLEGTRLPLDTAVYFIYCWSIEATSTKFCEREFDMDLSSVVDWKNYMREVCVWKMGQRTTKIGGIGKYVEIDESLLMCHNRNVFKNMANKMWVFGGICWETKECFTAQMPDRLAETLIAVIKENVMPGSIIVTDFWRVYKDIAGQDKFMKQSYHFIDPCKLSETYQKKRMLNSEKLLNKKKKGAQNDCLGSYVAEFLWRLDLNNRNAFSAILEDIAAFWPPK